MSTKPTKPGWPEAGAFPFMPFAFPGGREGSAAAATTASAASGFLQGMTGGVDIMKDFWSKLPGGAPLPGFMVPTIDVAELDKRISDLKAAESWVEINLTLLRTTIQGLEVQRNTIAAIHSLAAMAEPAAAAAGTASTGGVGAFWPPAAAPTPEAPAPDADGAGAAAADAPPPAAAQWLAYLQDQFARVAQAALVPTAAVAAAATPAAAPAGTEAAAAASPSADPAARRRRTPAKS